MGTRRSECVSCKNEIGENDSVIQVFSGRYVHEECILDYIFLNLEQDGFIEKRKNGVYIKHPDRFREYIIAKREAL